MARRKTVYIGGPITGVEHYWEPFDMADAKLSALGYNTLLPTVMPAGYTNGEYMRVCFALIDMADAVYFLPGSENSGGACLERDYCHYTGKPYTFDIEAIETMTGGPSHE